MMQKRRVNMLTQTRLKELFDCREDGMLIRKINSGTKKIGDEICPITDMHCFYHTAREQFMGLERGLYRLRDLDENTVYVYDTNFTEEADIMITVSAGYLISDFVMVPVDKEFNVDFTQAVEVHDEWGNLNFK
jgi:hypothetical protein